jgi:pyridoxamine 5'-phosphate oxidase
MSDIDVTGLRRTYQRADLREDTVERNPIDQLRKWLQDAYDAGATDANAMTLCTAGEPYPNGRIVLLRGLDERGLVFFSSYFSRKGLEIARTPRAALVFYWAPLERQVRVQGDVDQISDDESDAYFASRPRGHQLGAWASEQSETVECREVLDQRMLDYGERFEGEDVPRPHSWGGYLVRPQRIEFWQGRPNRMHDRLEFVRSGGTWTMQRLQP